MGRYVRIDRRHNQPYRPTGYGCRAVLKWFGLIWLWLTANIVLAVSHLGLMILATTGGLIWYAAYCVRRNRVPALTQQTFQPVTRQASQWEFNPPPGWPVPPVGWSAPPGWQPDPSWPRLAVPGL